MKPAEIPNTPAQISESMHDVSTPRKWLTVQRIVKTREFGLMVLIAIVFSVLAFTNENFLRTGNLIATAVGMSGILMVTAGMTIALISGGFDLSVGGVVAMTSVIMIALIDHVGVPMAVFLSFCTAWVVGLVNGILIAKVGINPLITTLGTLGMAKGIAEVVSKGTIVTSNTNLPDWFNAIGSNRVLGIPVMIIVTWTVIAIGDILVRRGRFFRNTFFIGGSERAALFAGLRVPRIQMMVYLLSATLAAFAGFLLASRFGAATADFGTGYELQAIAASVIGGASLSGGAGSLAGSFLAIALLALVQDSIVLYRVSVYWQDFISGVILVLAVAINVVVSRGTLFKR